MANNVQETQKQEAKTQLRGFAKLIEEEQQALINEKEIKKVGRFIQFAIAASEEALSSSGLKITPENDESVGVYIGSGIGRE